jgi:23S rRNA-/tRNA-specific pseudouridylate synthase
LKYLRYVHRIDAETTGILLFVKSPGATTVYTELFEKRAVNKTYLAVVRGFPREEKWTCRLPLAPDPHYRGRVVVDKLEGKEAITEFRVLDTRQVGGRNAALIEAHPLTGRSHQIRVHLAESGHAVAGDELYEPDVRGGVPGTEEYEMGLRAVELRYVDPFRRVPVRITAPVENFLKAFGFGGARRVTPVETRPSAP